MTQKEVKRAQILDEVKGGRMKQKAAARELNISARHIRRISKRYAALGLEGLISQKRGKPSNRQLDQTMISEATRLISENYRDFGPTLAAEKLLERHQLSLSPEKTRQIMIAAGYWKPKRGNTINNHPMRQRRARIGELIQIDGSPDDWFEGRGERCTLLVFIDDASGKLMGLRFAKTETTLDYMHTLYDYILEHGLPATLYSDKHSIFRINAKEAETEAETQFARAARELGIECITANSPQAKGRVERANQTRQDRLIKEMRLEGINDMETANAWLPKYMTNYNRRFAVVPREATDAHVGYLGEAAALQRILSLQMTRQLSKTLSCQYENELLQVEFSGTGIGMRGAKVQVHHHFDGNLELRWRSRSLKYKVMQKPQRQGPVVDSKQLNDRVDLALSYRDVWLASSRNPPRHDGAIGQGASLQASGLRPSPSVTRLDLSTIQLHLCNSQQVNPTDLLRGQNQ